MSHALALWEYALWGAFGGVAVEAIEILGAVKRTKGLPWNQPGEVTRGVLLFTVVVRLGLGAGLAVALGTAGQISGSIGAIAAGVSAPLILEQMGKQLPGQSRESRDQVVPPGGELAGGKMRLKRREHRWHRPLRRFRRRFRKYTRPFVYGFVRSTPAFGGSARWSSGWW